MFLFQMNDHIFITRKSPITKCRHVHSRHFIVIILARISFLLNKAFLTVLNILDVFLLLRNWLWVIFVALQFKMRIDHMVLLSINSKSFYLISIFKSLNDIMLSSGQDYGLSTSLSVLHYFYVWSVIKPS